MSASPAAYRAAHAARMREYRARVGAVRHARVNLVELGAHLEHLTAAEVRLLTVVLGDDVVRRARGAYRRSTAQDTTGTARGVAR